MDGHIDQSVELVAIVSECTWFVRVPIVEPDVIGREFRMRLTLSLPVVL
jgi:hypothetical protein